MLRTLLLILMSASLLAQEMPPSPVGYTEARQHRVVGRLTLPGTVESNVTSLVASEIAGRVIEYPVKKGDRVEKGQLLARLNKRNRELDIATIAAELREAEAREKLGLRNFERSQDLFDSKIFSQQQLDDTLYEHQALQARIENLKAEIERIEYDLEQSEITAPFAGVVIEKRTELGQWVGIGDEVVELLSLDDLEIRVDIPEQYYSSVRVGGGGTVVMESRPGRQLRGTITTIIPKADEQARTLPIKLRIPAGQNIGVGMLAQVQLDGVSTGQRGSRSAVIVPKDAVVRQGQRLMVWIFDDEGMVQAAPVETGSGVGGWIEVQGPVQPGAKVITRGNERLRPGQKVRGEPIEYKLP
jgi:membrane fusion protein, multidrug efflux system